MFFLLPVFLAAGLFLPGYFLAGGRRQPLWWASAFTLSLPVLFHSAFWLGILHVPITLWTVLPCLVGVAGVAAWLTRHPKPPAAAKPAAPWTGEERLLLAIPVLVGVVLLIRSACAPLIGLDTTFRWDYLAQKILALHRFDFYPPLTPADFRQYFYVDGIPPVVSFAHWWLYASVGEHLPILISLFVAAQFACTVAFTYGTAAALHSRRTGVLAAAVLATCPLYFRGVVIGQETGLTALAFAAMLYFIVTARDQNATASMLRAGAAAALCALSREYGWVALLAGVVMLLWRKQTLRQVLVFAAMAAALGAPWYLRNLALTGNPFYPLRAFGLPVNPVLDGTLQYYNSIFGVAHWPAINWKLLAEYLAVLATVPILAGLPAAVRDLRRTGYWLVIVALLIAVWLQSVGYTSAGVAVSMRVLSPLMVVLAILAAPVLESLSRRINWPAAAVIAILALAGWTALQGAVYPAEILDLPVERWSQAAFGPAEVRPEFQIGDRLTRVLPPGTRVLSDNAFLHTAMEEQGTDVVPIWSPEVSFLFTAPAPEAERRLATLHIGCVAVYPRSVNTGYLVAVSPFIATLPAQSRPVLQAGDDIYFLAPIQP
jgi:Dolichyl-phosphate-mannose-protein mannosyltransferase